MVAPRPLRSPYCGAAIQLRRGCPTAARPLGGFVVGLSYEVSQVV